MSGLKKYVTIATYFQYWFCRIGAFFQKIARTAPYRGSVI